jgi:hypothetical protein
MQDSLIKGNAGPKCKDHECDNKAPEIKFATITEGMFQVGVTDGSAHSVKEQYLVACID